MRLFERIRLNFGFMPIKPENDSKAMPELTDAANAAPQVPAGDGMCCGHCSDNVEGHLPELPTAR